MIADTTFVSDLIKERRSEKPGPAIELFYAHRPQSVRTTVVTAGEVALLFRKSADAFEWLARWKIYRLDPGVAQAAADIDRALRRTGEQLGENDTWIAGFAAYYREALISHDTAFDRVPGIRRVVYARV